MNTFQDTYNYLCGTETDNIITLEEFMEYYENVSMTIDNDEYFELMLNNGWGLNQNQKNYNKGWSNKNEENDLQNKNLAENYQERFGNRRPGQTEEEYKEEKVSEALKKVLKRKKMMGKNKMKNKNKKMKILLKKQKMKSRIKKFRIQKNYYTLNFIFCLFII